LDWVWSWTLRVEERAKEVEDINKKVIALTSDEPMPSGTTAAGSIEKPDDDMDKSKIISMDMVGSFRSRRPPRQRQCRARKLLA
jgi:hypothetical protein